MSSVWWRWLSVGCQVLRSLVLPSALCLRRRASNRPLDTAAAGAARPSHRPSPGLAPRTPGRPAAEAAATGGRRRSPATRSPSRRTVSDQPGVQLGVQLGRTAWAYSLGYSLGYSFEASSELSRILQQPTHRCRQMFPSAGGLDAARRRPQASRSLTQTSGAGRASRPTAASQATRSPAGTRSGSAGLMATGRATSRRASRSRTTAVGG